MERAEILRHVGHMQQLAYVQKAEFTEGRAKGLGAYIIKNDTLRLVVLEDKCLDIAEVSYKGRTLNFMAKPGLMGKTDHAITGVEGTRSLMGGFLFTCGLENTCLACEDEDGYHPMHGQIRVTPSEQTASGSEWEGDQYKMSVSGRMREARLFGSNLTLSRTVSTVYGESKFVIMDRIENQGFKAEPMMILYHFNFGYPFLDEKSEVLLPTVQARPRDKNAEKNAQAWNHGEAPLDNEAERVYLHELKADEKQDTMVAVVNEAQELAVSIRFNQKYLPHFVQWKSLASGDYALGLEPTNSGVYGRTREESLHYLEVLAVEEIRLEIEIHEGAENIRALREEIARLEQKN
ncbi:MAG: aldose 1-epimerase family protein [Lachnospiraceae bacterium]